MVINGYGANFGIFNSEFVIYSRDVLETFIDWRKH